MPNPSPQNNPAESQPENSYKESLIDHTNDLIWSVSNDYTLLAANKAFITHILNTTGIGIGPGDNVLMTGFPQALLDFYKTLYNRALQGESFREEIVFSAMQNSRKTWAEVNFNPLYNQDKIIGVACFSRNITEKKEAEEKLIQSEALLAEAQRLANIGSWNFYINEGKLSWSDELHNVFGTSKETFDETVDSFVQFIIPEDRERVLRSSNNARKSGEPFTAEFQIITPGGNRKYIREHGYSEKNSNGEVIRLFGTAQDITQQVVANQKVEIAERRLEVIYNTVSDIIFMLSVEGDSSYKFVSVNNTFLSATGLTFEQIIGQYVNDVIPSPSLELVLKNYNEAVKNKKTVSWEEETIYPTGTKYGAVTVSPVINEDGKCIQLVGSVHDITDQKKSEQKLIQSEEKYRVLFERSPMPMWIFDTFSLQFLQVNTAAIEHYGYSRNEFLSMTLDDIRIPKINVPLSDLENLHFRKTYPDNSIHKKKNGENIKVQVSVSAIEYENKKARLVLLVDRTEQEKWQEALVSTTQQLRELTSHLQSVREQERTNIAREIHDELGQQLTALKMDLAWIKRKLVGSDEAISKKINSSLQLVDGTINTVRKIASELRPSIIDDLGITEAIDWQGEEFSKRTGIDFEFHSGINEAGLSEGMPIALFRIVQEALTNVTRHANATKVTCKLEEAGREILLNITDNGQGFDTNDKTERKTLGLLGMKERVAMLNGSYEIISEPGKGTKVSVRIPMGNE